jgi:hypothetical protein
MEIKRAVTRTGWVILWIPLAFFAILLSHNAILYFTHGGEYGILPEKIAAQQDLIWKYSFYIHLPCGVFCLLSPFFLFARRFFKGGLHIHRIIGKLYTWITLLIVCPTGIYLALYAKGGLATQIGFILQGILLALFTWQGYHAILKRNKLAHFQGMIRSYAIATVVITFRIYHILFFLSGVPYQDNYAISQWLGLSGNLLLAEIIITIMAYKSKSSFQHNINRYETI